MSAEAAVGRAGPHPSNLRPAGLALAGFGVFAGTDAVVKLLAQGLSVPQITFMVTGFACLATAVPALYSGGGRDLWPRQPVLALVRAVLLAADTLLIYYAFARLPLADAYVLAFLGPVFVALMAALLLGERLSRNGWVGVVLGFVGVVVALRPGLQVLNLGHAAAACSALMFGLSILLLRKIRKGESEAALVVVLLVVSMLVSLALILGGGGFAPVGIVQLGLAALAGGGSALGHVLLIRAGRSGAASIVAPCQYSQLIWAGLYGLVLFGTPVDLPVMAGAAIIVLSGWLILR